MLGLKNEEKETKQRLESTKGEQIGSIEAFVNEVCRSKT